jgi:hypothetical protein
VAEYAILSYTRNSGFWLDNWHSACPERLFLLPKSRYFMKAEVVYIQTFLTKLSARVFTTVAVVGHYHITIHTRKYMHAETLALLTKPLYFPNMKYLK